MMMTMTMAAMIILDEWDHGEVEYVKTKTLAKHCVKLLLFFFPVRI